METKINSGVNVSAEILLIETKIKIQLDFIKKNPDMQTQTHITFNEDIFTALLDYYDIKNNRVMEIEGELFFVLDAGNVKTFIGGVK